VLKNHPDEILNVSSLGGKEPLAGIPIPEDPRAKQQLALKHLSVLFSPRVASMVAAVTNPPSSESVGLSYEEKLEQYSEKVKHAVETPEGWSLNS
jgi:hypothetical protein